MKQPSPRAVDQLNSPHVQIFGVTTQQTMPHSSIQRRTFLQASLYGAGIGSITGSTRPCAQAAAAPNKRRSLILLWQDGGPSHFETFDPKPNAPSEYRGELGAISTTLPGISYCEVLPKLSLIHI